VILRTCTLQDAPLLEAWDPEGEMWVGDKTEFLADRVGDRNLCMLVGENAVGRYPLAWGAIKLEPDCFVLAWFVAPLFRRSGRGLKLARMLVDMVEDSYGPIKARINANRPYSERIAVRLGMVPEGGLLETGEKWWVLRGRS